MLSVSWHITTIFCFMKITIVSLAMMDNLLSQTLLLMTQCGMVRVVPVITTVALSPTCQSSIVSCHWKLMKILRPDFAMMNHLMIKMFWLKNSSCMHNSRHCINKELLLSETLCIAVFCSIISVSFVVDIVSFVKPGACQPQASIPVF